MKSIFIFLTVFICTQIICAQNDTLNDAYHNKLLSQLESEYQLSEGSWVLNPTEAANADQATFYGNQTVTREEVSDKDFNLVINLNIPEMGANPWDAGYFNESVDTVKEGDKVLIVVWLRTASTDFAAPGSINLFAERPVVYVQEVLLRINPTNEWQQYLVPFEASGVFNPKDMRVGFHLSLQKQVIEMAGLAVINYGQSVELSDLPKQLHNENYAGIEDDAPWRQAAANRIEQYRKADMNLQFVDLDGNPMSNVTVTVGMQQHEYAFGTAVDTRRLANNSGFDETYQNKILNLDGEGHGFNWVVTENALKWRAWEQGWAGTKEETVQAIQLLNENNIQVRGHVLLWPGWSTMPDDMMENASDPAYLIDRIKNHMTGILNYEGVKGKVEEWDIINEVVHVRDLENALKGTEGYETGREIYAEVFNAVTEIYPSLITYLNDYNILSNGSVNGGDYTLFKSMATEIIDAGATIDGLGMQAHMGSALIAPDSLYTIIDDCYSTFNRPIKITEFDQSEVINDSLAAKYMGDFVTAVFSHPATNGFFMWGFWDGAHWFKNAPLFHKDWSPKPAFATFTDLLFNQWWTNETITSDENGNISVRGFKGDYAITTTINDMSIVNNLQLSNNMDTVITLPLQITNVSTTALPLIKVMPNPVKELLQISLPYIDDWNITICNSSGETVQYYINDKSMHLLDVQKYATGIYHLQIIDSQQKKYSQKIVVMP